MITFSALLAFCAGNSPVTGEFPAQRPVMQSFDVFFDLRMSKRLSKHSWGWWFETPSSPLWRHFSDISHAPKLAGNDVTTRKPFTLLWNFVMGIHRPSSHKGLLIRNVGVDLYFLLAWTRFEQINQETGNLRRHDANATSLQWLLLAFVRCNYLNINQDIFCM